MRLNTLIAATALFMATLGTAANAQSFATHPCGENSEDHSFIARMMNSGEQACELRSTTLPLVGGHLNLKDQNGSVELIGEDRQDIALEARVAARAGSASEAASILHQITIETGSTIEAHGPRLSGGNRQWSVSYKLRVPHRLAADLHTLNGSLALTALNGGIHAETTNGSVRFDNLAGDVHISTTNGSIQAKLDGPRWQGTGLEATTTNGGVTVSVPQNYSAHLVASTTNGGIHVNAPGADQPGAHRRSIDTNLGSGGPTISFETTNGGVTIQ